MNTWTIVFIIYLGIAILLFLRVFSVNAKKSLDLEETLTRIDDTYGCGFFGLMIMFWPISILIGILIIVVMILLEGLFKLIKGDI